MVKVLYYVVGKIVLSQGLIQGVNRVTCHPPPPLNFNDIHNFICGIGNKKTTNSHFLV